ncbi:hypothetical protein JOB18_020242 [Solea senegalensis]|uniref:Small nuclear RNA activating complex, polypeptide 1b n=1 Tax=Solea senegalensis TaxID=28829 RepID=A0AAV6RZF3_SOLSE|nr:snRNA-activating protein complex subunit 1b [Solea senegalensis]KAG7510374.1 hypothetical protein JOB18_020242 [Solea senegalensis]
MENYREQVKADCEQILGRFQEKDSVRFQVFATIWREMNFSHIFYGAVKREGRAFVRLILDTAYGYFLPPFSFQIRVGGLYLLYSLYQCQTNARRKQIRVALKDWDVVKKFEKDAVDAQHVDAVYILRRLMFLKAFHFTAMPTLLDYQKRRNVVKSTFCENFMDRSSHLPEIINTELLEELSNVHTMYTELKSSVFPPPQQTDSSVDLIHRDMVPQLLSTVKDFYKWRQRKDTRTAEAKDSGEGTSSGQESSKRARLIASIKSKAYGEAAEASKSRRHRQVEVNFSSSEAGPSFKPVYTRINRPSLKARTKDNVHIISKVWKDATGTTNVSRLTSLELDRAEIKSLRENSK